MRDIRKVDILKKKKTQKRPAKATFQEKPGKEWLQQRWKKGGLALSRLLNNRKSRLLPHIVEAAPETLGMISASIISEVQVFWDGFMCESHQSGCAVRVSSDTQTRILNKTTKKKTRTSTGMHLISGNKSGASD